MKRYFEYDKEDYYGLVVIEAEGVAFYRDKSDEIYHEQMGDHDIEAMEAEYDSTEVSKEYAFWKFVNCYGFENMTVKETLKEFNDLEDTCVVIDGSLI